MNGLGRHKYEHTFWYWIYHMTSPSIGSSRLILSLFRLGLVPFPHAYRTVCATRLLHITYEVTNELRDSRFRARRLRLIQLIEI